MRSNTTILDSNVQPIPLGVMFSKAQSSKLERLFCHFSAKRDIRALSFETAFENFTPSGIGRTLLNAGRWVQAGSPNVHR